MTTRLSTFGAGGLLLGVDVERVQEVIFDLEVTPVPLTHPSVVGLVNLRGQVMTAIDARSCFGLPPHATGDRVTTFILRTSTEMVALLVDSAGEVVDVDTATREGLPQTVSPTIGTLVTASYRLDEGLLLVLDTDRVLSVIGS
jgi:purine-binding chemotaxis protein CheW